MIYDFLEDNWDIVKWVALGIIVLEVSEEFFALARTQYRVSYIWNFGCKSYFSFPSLVATSMNYE